MNTIEEQLWDYIDGNLNEVQSKAIEEKLSNDVEFKVQYEELLNLNLAFTNLELEEPSMSFTRNVMEDIALVPAPISMKTKVDTRIIYAIGSFFVLALLALLSYAVYIANLSWPALTLPKEFTIDVDQLIKPLTINIFLFVDLIIGLIFLDYILRKKKMGKVG